MTDAEYNDWLSDLAAPRVVLCELDYAGGTEYLANRPYISKPTDDPPNRIYDDLIAEAIDITTRIDGEIEFGEIQLINDGEITHWSTRAWEGHAIRLYLGGPGWPLADFRLHAQGINAGINTDRRGELSFDMVDQSALFDEPIDTGRLPDDAGPVPLALGTVYNAPAFRTSDGTQYEYKASYLPCVSLTPKEGGSTSLNVTTHPAEGRFVLDAPTSLDLTVDIAETHNTPALLAGWVADYYGITVGEIALPAYAAGLYYSSEVTGRQVLDDLCSGLGAYWYLNALGALVVRQHVIPATPEVVIDVDDIEYDRIAMVETQQPWRQLTLHWGRNYAPVRTLAAIVETDTPTAAARLQREWSSSVATQPVDDHPQAEAITRDSCIQDETDAATERDRLLTLRCVRADVWEMDARFPPVFLGQGVEIDHPRTSGLIGLIISVSRSPTRSTTTLQVWFPAPWVPGQFTAAVDALDIAVQDTLPVLFEEA